MRIRSVKPDFWDDDVTGIMPAKEALFYVGLWCEADDAGRFEWDPAKIRAHLDPYDQKFGGVEGVRSVLDYLAVLGRVVRYQANGKHFGHIPKFRVHQHPQKPSIKHPAPDALPERYGTGTGLVVDGGEGRGGDGTTSRDGEQHSGGPLRVVPGGGVA
jgi:hypothetical protein